MVEIRGIVHFFALFGTSGSSNPYKPPPKSTGEMSHIKSLYGQI